MRISVFVFLFIFISGCGVQYGNVTSKCEGSHTPITSDWTTWAGYCDDVEVLLLATFSGAKNAHDGALLLTLPSAIMDDPEADPNCRVNNDEFSKADQDWCDYHLTQLPTCLDVERSIAIDVWGSPNIERTELTFHGEPPYMKVAAVIEGQALNCETELAVDIWGDGSY